MASPEDVIEPVAQSSTAQNLGTRRFLHDLHNLSPDEIDGLMSSSGKKTSPFYKDIKLMSFPLKLWWLLKNFIKMF